MTELRAVIVCVDFADFLQVTLPYNRHHFSEVQVITSTADKATQEVCQNLGVRCFVTDSFYDGRAHFNKWKALELGLDDFGRNGWLCLMDVDILWPRAIDHNYIRGCLYTPYRRMMTDLSQPVPQEPYWASFPRHPQQQEFAGFTQIFHAEDSVLGPAPWHETNWAHAGGADSFFQRKWPDNHKIRPNWECLHLGEAGRNWCGRVTSYLDGTTPTAAEGRFNQLRDYFQQRRSTGTFAAEKID